MPRSRRTEVLRVRPRPSAMAQPSPARPRTAWVGFLSWFLGGLGGPGHAPGIILFLRLRNPVERGLVSLLVNSRLLLLRLLCVALMPLAVHLRVCGRRDQRQRRR